MQYTDRFGQPLAVGDKIVVAVGAGRGSAELRETEIVGIVPLIPHRTETTKYGYDYQTKSFTNEVLGYYYMREDQQHKPGPTKFYRPKGTPPEQLFVLQYQLYGRDYGAAKVDGEYPIVATKVQSFDRVKDVVKVPEGV